MQPMRILQLSTSLLISNPESIFIPSS
jgi:hypothetical protein